MKSDSVSTFVHMRLDTHIPLYDSLHILNKSHPIFPVVYVLNGCPISQQENK